MYCIRLFLGFIIIIGSLSRDVSAVPVEGEFLPAIPAQIIETIQKARHPMLLANRNQFRNAKREFHRARIKEHGKLLQTRFDGYLNPGSPWYLGDGPFSESKDFFPDLIAETDFSIYQKAVFELAAYIGMELERDIINQAIDETTRLLDRLEEMDQAAQEIIFDARKARMTALTVVLYDMVYMRFDTVDRHHPNNQVKKIRDRLALYCSHVNPYVTPPEELALLGCALGYSTLFCISVYPDEWQRQDLFSVQSLLPDLYTAVSLTNKGISAFLQENHQFSTPVFHIENVMQVAIPFIETMKTLGYPFVVESGTYAKLASALETHRVPGSRWIVQPNSSPSLQTPWIPDMIPIFTHIASSTDVVEPTSAEDYEEELEMLEDQLFPQIQQGVTGQPVSIVTSPRALTLREMLEQGYPRPDSKAKPTPEPAQLQPLEGGWHSPIQQPLPSVWGCIYLLAAQEDPQPAFIQVLEDYVMEDESHPYFFLYWNPLPKSRFSADRSQSLVRYPAKQFTHFTESSPYGNLLLSSQAAQDTVLHSTYVIDHESFFLFENDTTLRWHHEIPVRIKEATEVIETAGTEQPRLLLGQELSSSLYSCWTTYSPAGKTVIVRKHLRGIGSAYSVVAHFPDPKNPDQKNLQYVNFQMREQDETNSTFDVPGLFLIRPGDAAAYYEPSSMIEWRKMRRAERMGLIDLSVPNILNILFSPETVSRGGISDGILGKFLETELDAPEKPFFYLLFAEQSGREKLNVKYPNLPLPGLRVLEWKQGIELLAVNTGNGIENDFIKSDADFVLLSRDQSMRGIFYLMVNGTQLQAKFSPTQRSWTTLASVKGTPVTAAWAERKVFTNIPPEQGSAFYAPDALGFITPNERVRFGRKSNQVVVLD